ncbi:MAG: hypothetical protein SX243_25445, partial [Acidobacteriota bacterium]|nr:hypothetical protein [Acidobacteriota bacterium]
MSRNSPQFLTGPATGDALDLAVDFLRSRTQKGAAEVDFNSLAVRDRYTTTHNGTTHLYLTQRVHGLVIANQVINVNVSARGEIINQGGR